MGSTTKTIRIDTEILEMITEYRKLAKRLFGFDASVNQILTQCVVSGFKDQMSFMRMLANGSMKDLRTDEGVPVDIPKELYDLVEKHKAYEDRIQLEEE